MTMKFDKAVALSSDTHRHLRFRAMSNFDFAAALHSAPLCASEFFAAAKEYAIVFVRAPDQTVFPVVVLGLKSDENLFIGGDGEWNARYLPAAVRAYPFTFIESVDRSTLNIVIDEAYPGFGDEQGAALFDENGAPAENLRERLKFLQLHQQDINRTRAFGAELIRLNLLTESGARLRAANDSSHQLTGFLVIDEIKINALGDADLLAFARIGHLALATAHLMSISNLSLLGPRLAVSNTPAGAAPRRSTTNAKAKHYAKN
jgi:hypothetical protein